MSIRDNSAPKGKARCTKLSGKGCILRFGFEKKFMPNDQNKFGPGQMSWA